LWKERDKERRLRFGRPMKSTSRHATVNLVSGMLRRSSERLEKAVPVKGGGGEYACATRVSSKRMRLRKDRGAVEGDTFSRAATRAWVCETDL
jgi:hypothetical protein